MNLKNIIFLISTFFYQSVTTNELLSKNRSCNINLYMQKNDTQAFHSTSTILIKNDVRSPPIKNDRLENEIYLKKISFLYGLTSYDDYLSEIQEKINETCLKELKLIKNGIDDKSVWAMRALDSSGFPKSGFILGDSFWLGSKIGCESLQTKLKLTFTKRYDRYMKDNLMSDLSPFDMQFRMLHAIHRSPWQLEMKFLGEGILHLGLCVPKSCSNNEIKTMSQKIFGKRTLQIQQNLEFYPDIIQVKDLQLEERFFNKITVKIAIGITVATLLLTLYGLVTENRDEDRHFIDASTISKKTLFDRVLKCFSVRDNFEWLFKTDSTPASIPVINGLRSIACLWILSFHVHWFMHFTLENEATLFTYAEDLFFQSLANAPILVDLFFTISGFLLSWNFLQNKQQCMEIKENTFWRNIILFGKMLFQRYIRLSSLYIIVILTTEIGTKYLSDVSQFYIHERNDLTFQKYWWRNFLYIQNLFPVKELCANWTWSLACEMQYFVIFTGLLFVFAKKPKLGKGLFLVFCIAAFVTTLGIAFYKNFNAAFDVLYETGTLLYIAPWARIHPYYVGIFAGYYLYQNNGQIYLDKKSNRLFWLLSTTINLLCFHATFIRDMHFLAGSCALTFQRLMFGVSVAWIIVASMTGNGNWFTNFLGQKIFVHINKLSYAIYLLNPIAITLIFGLDNTSSHTDLIGTSIITLSLMIIIYLLAIVFSLFFEIPYNRLSDEFLKSRRKVAQKLL